MIALTYLVNFKNDSNLFFYFALALRFVLGFGMGFQVVCSTALVIEAAGPEKDKFMAYGVTALSFG